MSTEAQPQGVGARTLRGMLWAYGSFAGVRLSSLLATAVLARLLAPKDFGLIALATTFMAFLDVFQGLGVGNALVVTGDDELEESADTAFVLSTTIGLVLWIVAAALGPVAATTFHQHRLVEVMPALGATFFLYGVSATHYSLALRQINIRSRTAAEVAEAVTRAIVGIALALTGFGVWSLIVGYVVGAAALMVVLLKLVKWRPHLRLHRAAAGRLLRYGGALTGVAVMAAFLSQFDNAVVGRVLGSTQLGYYSIAGRLPALFIITLASASGDVLFPAFAQLRGEAFRRAFLTSLRYTGLIALPLTAVLITLARPITIGVFGSQWGPAVAATQVLCLWALMSPISMVCGNVLKASNRATMLLVFAFPQAIALVIGSLLLVHDGIVVLSWLQAGIAIATQVVMLVVAQRLLGAPALRVLDAIGRPAVASAGLAAALVGVKLALGAPWPTIIAGAVVTVTVYPTLVWLLMPTAVTDLLRMAFPTRMAAYDARRRGTGEQSVAQPSPRTTDQRAPVRSGSEPAESLEELELEAVIPEPATVAPHSPTSLGPRR